MRDILIVGVHNEMGYDNETRIFNNLADILNHASKNKKENYSYVFIPKQDFDLLQTIFDEVNDPELEIVQNFNETICKYVQGSRKNHCTILNIK